MNNKETLDNLKAPLIKIIEQNLPATFMRQEADGVFGIDINEKGEMSGFGYAEDLNLENMSWKDLPLLDLTQLVVEILGSEELLCA